jgi:hypothetical protein
MNWEAIGAIAELIGGVAVLITLIYLSIQVRQNSRIQRQQNVTEQTNRCIDSGQLLASDPEFADIFSRAMNNTELTIPPVGGVPFCDLDGLRRDVLHAQGRSAI